MYSVAAIFMKGIFLEIIFIGVIAFIIVFLILIYLRKLHWDAIHNNLFDLVDDMGGTIIRHGFATRPIYHGKYQENELTVNFSMEKTKKGRVNYIDISLSKKIKYAITISSKKWLEENNAELLKNFIPFKDKEINKYGMSLEKTKNIDIDEIESRIKNPIKHMDSFNFIFFGGTGVLLEIESDNIARATRHPALKNNIIWLVNLVENL